MWNRDRWLEVFETLRKNKLRAALSGFTVALGIFIFVTLYGFGNGLKNAFQELERSVDKSLDQDEVQSLSNIEKEIDDLGNNNRYIKTVPSIGPDNWMTE